MSRLTALFGLVAGMGVGIVAGCVPGRCEPDPAPELVDARYVPSVRVDTTLGAYQVAELGDFTVDVDLDGARVVVRFVDTADRQIVQTYDIVSTEQGWL